jgi:hypothetical protein
MATIVERHRGRPRKTWAGKFGAFVSSYRIENLSIDVDVDPASCYRWARGDSFPSIPKAIAIVEIARRSGLVLSLEDIYETEVNRVRGRMRAESLTA